jgi:hypothetical protein
MLPSVIQDKGCVKLIKLPEVAQAGYARHASWYRKDIQLSDLESKSIAKRVIKR